MQAIVTKLIPATDHHGTRVKATCAGGSITIPFDYEKDEFTQQRDAAWKLVAKLGWEKSNFLMETGTLPNGDLCHVYFMDRG